MGKPIVATDADGLLDILQDRRDALVVPKADAAALAEAIVTLIEQPALAAELAAGARATGARYDIGVFVRKMERLYELLHESSRRTKRQGILQRRPGVPLRGRRAVSGGWAARSEAWRLGAASTALLAVVLLGWAISVNYPKLVLRLLLRRVDLLRPRPQPRRRRRLRVPPRRPGARLARVPERARGHLPQARRRPRRCASTAPPRSCTSTSGPTPIRRGSTSPSRSSIRCSPRRSSGCSAPTASWCCTRWSCWRRSCAPTRSWRRAASRLRRCCSPARSCSCRSCRSTWCGSRPISSTSGW